MSDYSLGLKALACRGPVLIHASGCSWDGYIVLPEQVIELGSCLKSSTNEKAAFSAWKLRSKLIRDTQ